MNKEQLIEKLDSINEQYYTTRVRLGVEFCVEYLRSLDVITKNECDNTAELLKSYFTVEKFFKGTKNLVNSYCNVFLGTRNKTEILNRISALPQVENQTGYSVDGVFIYYFWKGIKPTKNDYKKRTEKYEESLSRKSAERINNDYDRYLRVSEELILSDNPYEILVGILAVTARRPIEVFNYGQFIIDDKKQQRKMKFNNKAKTKGNSTVGDCYSLYPVEDILFHHNRAVEVLKPRMDYWKELSQQMDAKSYEKKFNESRDSKKMNEIFKQKYGFLNIPKDEKLTLYFTRKISCIMIKMTLPAKFRDTDSESNKTVKMILGDTSDVFSSYNYLFPPKVHQVANLTLPKFEPKIISHKTEKKEPEQLSLLPEKKDKIRSKIDGIITTIKKYNETVADSEKIAITKRVIITLMGYKSDKINTIWKTLEEEANKYNSLFGFNNYQNRGKNLNQLPKI